MASFEGLPSGYAPNRPTASLQAVNCKKLQNESGVVNKLKLKLTVPNDRMYRLPRYFAYVQQIIEDCRLDESSKKSRKRAERHLQGQQSLHVHIVNAIHNFSFSPQFFVFHNLLLGARWFHSRLLLRPLPL